MSYILNLLTKKKKNCYGPPQTLSSETFKILGLLNLYYSDIYFNIFISATMLGSKQWFEEEDKIIQIFFCGIKINLPILIIFITQNHVTSYTMKNISKFIGLNAKNNFLIL